jgi:putative transposase
VDELAREGARRMLAMALEAEVAEYLEGHAEERDERGHALVVRNGKSGCSPAPSGCSTR